MILSNEVAVQAIFIDRSKYCANEPVARTYTGRKLKVSLRNSMLQYIMISLIEITNLYDI